MSFCVRGVAIFCLLLSACVSAAALDIPAQSLARALEDLARQAEIQILYVPEQVRELRTPPLRCDCQTEEALAVLLQGSGLEFVIRDDTVVVRPARKQPVTSPKVARDGSSGRWPTTMEEILVTAQKRKQPARDVPIAMNVLAGDRLNAMGVKDADDIENLYSNLSTNNRSAVNSGFAIRGVGTNNFHISGKQSVGVNIDGVAAFSPFVSTIGMYDMERIEVLRGPQNTLYGRNTIGGVINFHTRQAVLEDGFNGRATVNVGNGGLAEFEAAIGFTLAEDVAVRIAGFDNSFDGAWTNLVDGTDFGEKDKSGARLNLLWEVTENTAMTFGTATGDADGQDDIKRVVGNLNRDGVSSCAARLTGEPAFISGINNCWVRVTAGQVAANDYLAGQLFADNTDFIMADPIGAESYLVNYSAEWGKDYIHPAVGYTADYDNLRFSLVHDFSGAEFTWISAYDELSVKNITIYGGLTGFQAANEGDWEVWQHEVRLASSNDADLRWLVGFYYTTEDSKEDTWVTHTEFPTPGIQGPRSDAILIDSEYEGWSVYGQADYDFTDTLSVTAGIRYTDDKLEGQARKSICNASQGVTQSFDETPTYDRDFREAAGCDANGELATNNPIQELSEVGWKLGFNWRLHESSLAYISVSEGFKGGAYDNRAQANGQQPVGPEFLTAYEIGLKTELFANTLQLNAAYYWYDWQDLQQFATQQPGNIPRLLNIPSVELQGLELEAKWAPNDTLFVQAGVGFSDNEVVEITAEQEAILGWERGYEVTNAPDVTANLLVVNTIPLKYGELVLQASYRYMSDYFFYTADPDDQLAQAGDHSWLNGRVAYNFGERMQHSIALWGNNLTEEKSLNQISAGLPGGHQFPGTIRDTGEVMWGISLETSF